MNKQDIVYAIRYKDMIKWYDSDIPDIYLLAIKKLYKLEKKRVMRINKKYEGKKGEL